MQKCISEKAVINPIIDREDHVNYICQNLRHENEPQNEKILSLLT